MNYSIAEEGFPICVGTLLFSAGLLAFDLKIAGTVLFFLFLAETFFFRDPERIRKTVPGAVLSPADGRVLEVGDSGLSIFMSLFNVHVNRIPVGGAVDAIDYKKGRFKAAYLAEAEKENEQNTVVLKSTVGNVTVTQIAGIIARRIVCRIKIGDEVQSGQRFGMIKFGSRIRITLPPDAKINVRIGDRVKAGITVIAHGKERGA